MLGMLTLTIQHTMASTHTWGGVNYADAFNVIMVLIGSALVLGGVGYLFRSRISILMTVATRLGTNQKPL
jgi:hypothetical protein